ncbi:siroheme decarboxylase subunit beta [Methanolacinia paynteri]|uniref:siroheme decarboxylase subunit beta n=1 Tax=Methanolacinia paynteri TaxID=230356 RepID=UPI00064FA6B0|nr:AsnC family transcriptional regulator [Methanolacinia paynteri]
MDETDYKILNLLEEGMPVVIRPFDLIGERAGISGEEVIGRLRRLHDEGAIKTIKARINQRKIGISANALVAWNVPSGWNGYERLASYPGVSHCYKRSPVPGRWDYTVYTVHHRHSREEVYEEVKEIAEDMAVDDYVVIFSSKELKRVPAVRICEKGGCPE